MENVTQFKTRLITIGGSKYILVPKNIREYEGIDDATLLMVTLEKLEKKE